MDDVGCFDQSNRLIGGEAEVEERIEAPLGHTLELIECVLGFWDLLLDRNTPSPRYEQRRVRCGRYSPARRKNQALVASVEPSL